MDALYTAGLRPSDGYGSVGQLGATRAHLEDMRAVVAAVLPCQPGRALHLGPKQA